MEAIVSDNLAHTSAIFTYSASYPPMPPRPANQRLLEIYDSGSRALGHGEVTAVDPRRAGAADISFAADHVDMALDGLGLMGGGGHTVDEVADLATLVSQAQRAALLMYRLSQGATR
jgi:glutamate carboxypeptidase